MGRAGAGQVAKGWCEVSAPSGHLPKKVFAARKRATSIQVSRLVTEGAGLEENDVYARLETLAEGLTSAEAGPRLLAPGYNTLPHDERAGFPTLLARAALNPLVILLAALVTISAVTGVRILSK